MSSQKTVFTNGCFDLLHIGHTRYLNEARALGDRLVVGLNSDSSVQKLKGPSRPYVSEEQRKEVLLSLAAVDEVFIFEEETPLQLIKNIRPDILVKGGDYKIEDIVGAPEVLSWGGEVKSLSFYEGFSSSDLIEKIKKS